MKIFTLSDPHFDHERIIELCNRPFANVDEMNQKIIENWNKTVDVKDIAYLLGDFGWSNPPQLMEYLEQLNGKVYLMKGNHDKSFWNYLKNNSYPYMIHDQIYELSFDGKKSVLCHYPIEEWDGFYKNVMHYHGHVHNKKLSDVPNRINVSVEMIDYTPHLIGEL